MLRLDASQTAFCEAPPGNLRLLAPAGCGKTLCLLYRCRYLANLSRGHRTRFLVVTFTVAAKQELLARLNEEAEFAALRDNTEVTTLNAWGWRRVRNVAFSPKLVTGPRDYHFAMLNQLQGVWKEYPDVKRAIEAKRNTVPRRIMDVIDAFKSLGFDHLQHSNLTTFSDHVDALYGQSLGWRLQEQFDELTKHGVLSAEIGGDPLALTAPDKRRVYNSFFRFWRAASAHLVSNATFTLEDQKYVAYLDEAKKVQGRSILSGAARYDHVLVDEFQDINPLDLKLIKAIVDRNRSTLTIVGDDDQAIFEWRGATPEYILEPDHYFGLPFSTHTLTVNYRSPVNIVDRSQQLISHNKRRVHKDIRAYGTARADIELRKTSGLYEALEYVHLLVKESVDRGSSPSRVAIIGRKRSQIIPYQVFFASKDVAFCAAEDLQVFLSDAFDRLLELLITKTRATSRQSSSQIVADLLKLCDLAKRYPLSKKDREGLRRYLHLSRPRRLADAVGGLELYDGTLKGPNKNRAMSTSMASAVSDFIETETVSEALLSLSENFAGLRYDLGKAESDIFYTDPPFLQLAEYASRYGDDYDDFVDDIELAKDQLVYIPPFEESGSVLDKDDLWRRPLHLMTALRAKGKEFDVVVLLGVRDGIWPSKQATTSQQIEAERRVFYVAFTRAKKKVVMVLDERAGNHTAVASPYIGELGLRI